MAEHHQPSVLDACCGSRMFYFDKNNPNVLHVDIRRETLSSHGRTIHVQPDLVADFRDLPFDNESFSLVIFDPPHLLRAGPNSYMKAKYGRLTNSWRNDIKAGFDECWRVLKPTGTLVFKWSEVQIPLKEVLKLAPTEPLIGNRGTGAKTHWILFFKPERNAGR